MPQPATLIVQPGHGLAPVLDALRKAKHTIDVSIFRLTMPEVEKALEDAVARGVKVRALVAHKAQGEGKRLREVEQRLLAAGVAVSRTAENFIKYHGKYLIIDDTLHLLGFNFKKSNLKSRSFGVHTRNKRAVQDALRLFECDVLRQPFTPSRQSPLVVSPETSRTTLERFISKARSQLAIYDGRLDDEGFAALILQRAAAGVTVRVIGEAPALKNAVPVRPLKDMKLHVRAIIRDTTHAFVGSQSLRPRELDERREVGLIVANACVARLMLEVFETDWEQAATPKIEHKEEKLEFAPVA
jgi:phosphatidylserine/phosphatidylglycerophosphate/cardiolipin synthase-like enzyme